MFLVGISILVSNLQLLTPFTGGEGGGEGFGIHGWYGLGEGGTSRERTCSSQLHSVRPCHGHCSAVDLLCSYRQPSE